MLTPDRSRSAMAKALSAAFSAHLGREVRVSATSSGLRVSANEILVGLDDLANVEPADFLARLNALLADLDDRRSQRAAAQQRALDAIEDFAATLPLNRTETIARAIDILREVQL